MSAYIKEKLAEHRNEDFNHTMLRSPVTMPRLQEADLIWSSVFFPNNG